MQSNQRFRAFLAVMLLLAGLTGCAEDKGGAQTSATSTAGSRSVTTKAAPDYDLNQKINVVSREDGSGTRGAFIGLTGVETKDSDGKAEDRTTKEANITNSTKIMMSTVAADPYAIGYISLGSLNDTVRALDVDGVKASVDDILNNTYPLVRPFLLAVKATQSDLTKDFAGFILSPEGQAVVGDNGYIPVEPKAYASARPAGKIVVAGSSSVTPVMDMLREAYLKINTGAEIEIQTNDSTTGIKAAIDGRADIGMASRVLKDTEIEAGVSGVQIAADGIAVIVNKENPFGGLELKQIRDIYTGDILTWSEVA